MRALVLCEKQLFLITSWGRRIYHIQTVYEKMTFTHTCSHLYGTSPLIVCSVFLCVEEIDIVDDLVGVTTRHLVGIDATLYNSWQLSYSLKDRISPRAAPVLPTNHSSSLVLRDRLHLSICVISTPESPAPV